jgi:hypothetical protein
MGVKRLKMWVYLRWLRWHANKVSGAKTLHLVFLMLILSACSAVPPAPHKIALLAPFEGQYRDIGYEALYAAQMSLKEGYNSVNSASFIILPLDDGGTIASARERAQALTYDSSIVFVLALGPYATAPDVQEAYGDLQVLMVGYWPSIPQRDNIAAFTADFRDVLPTVPDPYLPHDEPLVGGELLSLSQFDVEDCTIWSSAAIMSDDFRARYEAMNPFAPPARLIGSLAYAAASVALETVQTKVSVRDFQFNGERFFNEDGYIQNTARNEYRCGLHQ